MHDLDGLRAALDGDLLTPDSPGYDAARRPALARFRDVRPRAVVRCASAIAELLDELIAGPNGRRELNFTAMGGAYNRVAADATAFVHRGERFLLEHVAGDDPQWAGRSWSVAHPHGSGRVYPNFPDLQLEDWAAAYHGGNLPRLAAAKQRYDPGRLFHFPQAI